jgi:hypothetical protein
MEGLCCNCMLGHAYGHGKPMLMFRSNSKHVLHASTQAKLLSSTHNSSARHLWCVQVMAFYLLESSECGSMQGLAEE